MADTLKLVIDDGVRDLDINGFIVKIRPGDAGYAKELQDLTKRLETLAEEYDKAEGDDDMTRLMKLDEAARFEFDSVFGVGFSDAVFGESTCFAFVNGVMLLESVLYGIIDIMHDSIDAQDGQREAAINKYTSKYKRHKK
jgi:hypothetical protein